MKNRARKTVAFCLLFVGLCLVCALFLLFWVRYYNPYIRLPFYKRGNFALLMMYAMVLCVSTAVMKGHKLGEARVWELVISQCVALLLSAVIVYFPMSLLQYELLEPLPLLGLLLLQWLTVLVWNLIANKLYFMLIPPLRLLCVGEQGAVSPAMEKLMGIPQRFRFTGSVSIAEGREAVLQKLSGCDGILFSAGDADWRVWVTGLCFERNLQLLMVPTMEDIIVHESRGFHSIDTPLLCSSDHRLSVEERFIKRGMDIVLSLIALLLFSPLMAVCALLVKLWDGGPVLFRQERLTRDGRVFRICKFRTMVVDAEKDGQRLAADKDERITGIGRILRKLRMDELPQLFNVLKGEMSLVGPRPECPAIARAYQQELPAFAQRLKVKAGITGYAQVYGDYTTSPGDKLLMDVMYIERYSLFLDLNLMLLTLRALFMTGKTRGKR